MGAAVVECDGDRDSVPVGEAGDCDRADAAAELQETLPAAVDDIFMAVRGGLSGCDGHGGVPGRGAGAVPADGANAAGAWVYADGLVDDYGVDCDGGGVCDSGARPGGVSMAGARHHVVRWRDWFELRV